MLCVFCVLGVACAAVWHPAGETAVIFTGQRTVVVVKVIHFVAIGGDHVFRGRCCTAILVGGSVNHRSVCAAAPQVGAVQRIEGTVTEIRKEEQNKREHYNMHTYEYINLGYYLHSYATLIPLKIQKQISITITNNEQNFINHIQRWSSVLYNRVACKNNHKLMTVNLSQVIIPVQCTPGNL